jgi:hypothetical protein
MINGKSINGKSINRVLAESLFNLAKQKQNQVEGTTDGEKKIFDLIEGTSSSTSDISVIPEAQAIIADGTTAIYQLNGTPARADLIDVWVNDVLQHPEEIYETIGDVIQFFEIPPQGTDIYIKFR